MLNANSPISHCVNLLCKGLVAYASKGIIFAHCVCGVIVLLV